MSAELRNAEPLPALASPATATAEHSYGQILKSSALIGGSSALTVGIGIARTKAMALLLGPAGFGLMGIYGSIADVAVAIAGMGINSSGVRQIAAAAASGDAARVARTAGVLRSAAVVLGLVGAGSMVALSGTVSALTFGTEQHAGGVALLSLVVLFRLLADGKCALIQGMRRISDLAGINVLGALLGTLTAVPIVYFLRADGVVPALVCTAAFSIGTAWWYARRVQLPPVAMTASEARHEAASLLRLGFAFMASGFAVMGAAYAVRIIVVRSLGLEAAGYYGVAWTLGGLYVGFVLQAMGADFYPRLVGVARDNARCNRLVNEQTRVSILLAGPGVLATLTFAPQIVALLYSAEFDAAVGVLRWVSLGMMLRVITWPMGYVIVAKDRRLLFLGVDLAWSVVNVALAYACLQRFGLDGAGIAFLVSYVFHALVVYPIVRRLSGFGWSQDNVKLAGSTLAAIALVFCGFALLPVVWATALGIFVTVLCSFRSCRALLALLSRDRFPRPLRSLLAFARIGRR